jgi:hypothetical protein
MVRVFLYTDELEDDEVVTSFIDVEVVVGALEDVVTCDELEEVVEVVTREVGEADEEVVVT